MVAPGIWKVKVKFLSEGKWRRNKPTFCTCFSCSLLADSYLRVSI